jgi:two-component system, NarL family, response regulator DesR
VLVAEGATSQLRILVVDDHDVVRGGLRYLLAREPSVARCVGAAGAEEALELVRALTFDVALVDVDLGVECGLDACERLQAAVPGLRTALLTSRWDLVPLRSARAVGACGAIAKEQPARALLRAVQEVAAGRACEPALPAPGEVRFVPREKEILRLAAAGKTNAEIGATMFLAPGTIKHHLIELFEKLGAPNRAAAVHTARRLGVLSDAALSSPAGEAGAARRLRVLVADACDARRAGLLLALQGRVAALAGARDTQEALEAAERLCPDVALVAGDALRAALDGIRTLAVEELEALPGERIAGAVAGAPAAVDDPVSPRERDVLAAFARGATNRAAAGTLGLSPHTVKQHASSIYRKLGVRNRAEAVHRADELGLL